MFRLPAFQHVERQHIPNPYRICSREWTPARACGSSYSKARNPSFTLPLRFDRQIGNILTAVGASGLPILMDTFVASHQVPGGQHRQDPRLCPGREQRVRPRPAICASRRAREHATRPTEVGVGLHPGGGGAERLPHLVGRGRALENHSRRERFRRPIPRTIRIRQPGASGRPSWTASSTRSRAGSPPRPGVPSRPRRISSTRSRSVRRRGSSTPSPSFETALTWPEAQQRIKVC